MILLVLFLLLAHRLIAAHHRSVSAFGYDEFRVALIALVSLACLVCHGDNPLFFVFWLS